MAQLPKYTRNLSGFVTRLVNRQGTTVLSQFDYIYYLDGNTHRVTEVMDGVTRTVTYTYDTARRLTREHDTGAGGGAITRAYTFDNRGNRTTTVVTGAENYTVRHELSTGQLVGGKSHIQKAAERITNLENIIRLLA